MSNIIDKIQLSGVTYDIGGQGGSGVSVVEVTQAEYDALPSSAKTDTSKMYVITDAQAGDLTQYWTSAQTSSAITQAVSGKVDTTTFNTYSGSVETALSGKQDTLVSGTNIKTINNESILGSGNIDIQGGGGGTVDQTFDRDSTNAIANSAVTRNTVGSYGSASTGGKTFLQAYDQKGHSVDKLSIGFSKINNTPIFKKYSNLSELTNFSLVETSAITTSISSSSTDAQVPSAKCLYDAIGDIETLLSNI